MHIRIFALTLAVYTLPLPAQAAGNVALELGLLSGLGVSFPITEHTEARLGMGTAYLQGYSADLRWFRETGQVGSYWYLGGYQYDRLLGFSTTPGTVVTGGVGSIWGSGNHHKWGADIGPSYHVERASYGIHANVYLRFVF